ncbi:MAG: AtpZ/AtpI family protein [Candidatus Moranbacteria bacterium]|nr:AtpZ/AtpI family protein [Candidatus Moranbacteria bacterium]
MKKDKNNREESLRDIVKGSAIYTGVSILTPMIFFGGIGLFLDKHFQKKPLFILIFIGIAFIITNILLFKKTRMLTKKMEQYSDEIKKESL